MIDIAKLNKPRTVGDKLVAQCPACAEAGADTSCNHLSVFQRGEGKFACIAHQGPSGHAHRKRIFELVGIRNAPKPQRRLSPRAWSSRDVPRQVAPEKRVRIDESRLRPLSPEELTNLATLRGWYPEYAVPILELLADRGLLQFGEVYDDEAQFPSWIVLDSTRRNAQARRLDGGRWEGLTARPGKLPPKAKTLPGGDPRWPIGASLLDCYENVVLCEGGPDFLAALFVAWWEGVPLGSITPVCMTGAGPDIHDDALPLFAGKRVLIPQHLDANRAGEEAAKKWAGQLFAAGAKEVRGFDFAGLRLPSGEQVKDLADYARLITPGQLAAPRRKVFGGF